MLTNFPTIRKAVKKMSTIDKMMADPSAWKNLSKRERLQITRQRAKLEKTLGSIVDLTRLPAAMFVIDVMKEHIAVREANKLNIPVFGMVDTNSNPAGLDFVIPANDDATKSIELITGIMVKAMEEGLSERKVDRDNEAATKKDKPAKKEGAKKEGAKKPRIGAKDKASEENAPEGTATEEGTTEAKPAKAKTAKVKAPKEETPKAETPEVSSDEDAKTE